jgi:hypothetical protein
MSAWAISMLISGGLFAGGTSLFAWERIPSRRTLSAEEFQPDLARSIRRADRYRSRIPLEASARQTSMQLP